MCSPHFVNMCLRNGQAANKVTSAYQVSFVFYHNLHFNPKLLLQGNIEKGCLFRHLWGFFLVLVQIACWMNYVWNDAGFFLEDKLSHYLYWALLSCHRWRTAKLQDKLKIIMCLSWPNYAMITFKRNKYSVSF